MAKATRTVTAANGGPVLDATKTICSLNHDDIQLKVDQTIDYKSATEEKVSMGKIKSFIYAGHDQCDKESIWMNVQDILVEGSSTEWISVNLWLIHFKNGLFNKTKTEKNDAGNKRKTSKQRPF